MKLYCLSPDPSKPCYVLSFNKILLMLDCGVSAKSLLNFLPLSHFPLKNQESFMDWDPPKGADESAKNELKLYDGKVFVHSIPEFCPPSNNVFDFADIDVILISNYSLILGLPYITEYSNFSGVVYATEPTLQFGKIYLQELLEYIETVPDIRQAKFWKDVAHLLPEPLCNSFKPKTWEKLFTKSQLETSFKRVKTVSHEEVLDIFGFLKVKAVSSGYRLGSANWVITTQHEKTVYMSTSSTLTTHRKEMDISSLKNANTVILSGLRQNHFNPGDALSRLCSCIGTAVRGGGSVLMPCYPSGTIYDLLEAVSNHLDSIGFSSVPMYFISPVAETSLALSNIYGEWLTEAKQYKMYSPEEPFTHAFLIKNKRLKYYKQIYSEGFDKQFTQPCILFCGHPSLRFGDVVHFIKEWASNPLHTLVLTEPDFSCSRVLEPFKPLKMGVVYCPIDISLNFSQANQTLKRLNASSIVVPTAYTTPSFGFPDTIDYSIDKKLSYIINIDYEQGITLPVKRQFVKAWLHPMLAGRLKLISVRPGISLASITGAVILKDNNYQIVPLQETDEASRLSREIYYEFGQVLLKDFLTKVENEGLPQPRVESVEGGYNCTFGKGDVTVLLKKDFSHVCCGYEDEYVRKTLRAILMDCLKSF